MSSSRFWRSLPIPSAESSGYLQQLFVPFTHNQQSIPKHIFLIWFGSDLPNSEERPYVANLLKHKELNPDAIVELIVAKQLLAQAGCLEKIVTVCHTNGIILSDVHERCASFINYDLIKQCLDKPRDYVIASDFLRLALIYHCGGWYYDTDITPLAPQKQTPPPYGFYQRYPQHDRAAIDFCFHAAVPGHIMYLLASATNRYLYEQTRDLNFPWLHCDLKPVRHKIICNLSGNPLAYLIYQTSLLNGISSEELQDNTHYPLEKYAKVNFDHSWLDEMQEESSQDSVLAKSYLEDFDTFMRFLLSNIHDKTLLLFCQGFFNIYLTVNSTSQCLSTMASERRLAKK